MSGDFEPEQKRYLEGFAAGLQIAKSARAVAAPNGADPAAGARNSQASGPDAAAIRAQDRAVAAGGKLSDQEKFKRELNPFDGYARLKEQARNNEPPKPPDNFRWRFYGLFYVAPAQNSYMCRLRIPNGILNARQFAGVADLAQRYGGGYVQKAQHFALPADPAVPIIMIGPGTGIAPFRAFLYERMATKAPGRNWLFFGHQRCNCDFFYEDELIGMRAAGLLTRLTLAWSRDSDEKIYVQHRMAEVGRDVWRWINDGAHIYVCGDAQHMAKDVERALIEIIAAHGARTSEQAAAFLAELKSDHRYQTDVY